MRALSTEELLTVWELGESQPANQRALALLAVGCADDAPPEQLAQLSIGQRDLCLLVLRARTFGPRLTGLVACDVCGELLEFGINSAEIGIQPDFNPAGPFEMEHTGCMVRFRLPNSLDLASLDQNAPHQVNRQRLLRRCVLSARRAAKEIPAEELPPEVVAAVAGQMAQADPQGEMEIALACQKCSNHWLAAFDILTFFWCEINAWAVRQLHEVHVLASAYGWREADILSLSPARRQAYLKMVQP
jgi:hypothetical protein